MERKWDSDDVQSEGEALETCNEDEDEDDPPDISHPRFLDWEIDEFVFVERFIRIEIVLRAVFSLSGLVVVVHLEAREVGTEDTSCSVG